MGTVKLTLDHIKMGENFPSYVKKKSFPVLNRMGEGPQIPPDEFITSLCEYCWDYNIYNTEAFELSKD